MSAGRPVKVLIAASGSGGHLFPALHIARAILAQSPEAVVEFVGSGRPLEAKIVDRAGFRRTEISVVGLKRRGILGVTQSLFYAPRAVLQVMALFRRFRPDVVIGVGGYVTFLPVVVARFLGVPTWIHEAEIKPGMANSILALIVDRISIAFAECTIRGGKRKIFTGHPVRSELMTIPALSVDSPSHILIVGGSQGASSLDKVAIDLAPFCYKRGLSVVHQCRPENVSEVSSRYIAAGYDVSDTLPAESAQLGMKAHVLGFIEDMPKAYAWSHIIVGRSGAGSVMEISVVGRPAILVPYPSAQGDHQSANALTLVSRGQAVMVKEGVDFAKRLCDELQSLLDSSRFQKLIASGTNRPLDAAKVIAAESLSLAGKHAALVV